MKILLILFCIFIAITRSWGAPLSIEVKDSKGVVHDIDVSSSKAFGLKLKPYGAQNFYYFNPSNEPDSINFSQYSEFDQIGRKKILYGRLKYFSLKHVQKKNPNVTYEQLVNWSKEDIDFELSMIGYKRASINRITSALIWGGVFFVATSTLLQIAFQATSIDCSNGVCDVDRPLMPIFLPLAGVTLITGGIIFSVKILGTSPGEAAGVQAIRRKKANPGNSSLVPLPLWNNKFSKKDLRFPLAITANF